METFITIIIAILGTIVGFLFIKFTIKCFMSFILVVKHFAENYLGVRWQDVLL